MALYPSLFGYLDLPQNDDRRPPTRTDGSRIRTIRRPTRRNA